MKGNNLLSDRQATKAVPFQFEENERHSDAIYQVIVHKLRTNKWCKSIIRKPPYKCFDNYLILFLLTFFSVSAHRKYTF